MIFLSLEELLHVAARTLGAEPEIRDLGLLGSAIAFYGMNGLRLTLTDDQAYDLVIDVASGTLNEVPKIASVLEASAQPR